MSVLNWRERANACSLLGSFSREVGEKGRNLHAFEGLLWMVAN